MAAYCISKQPIAWRYEEEEACGQSKRTDFPIAEGQSNAKEEKYRVF
jgi:hypothetical protein